jgi:hypothetical protein
MGLARLIWRSLRWHHARRGEPRRRWKRLLLEALAQVAGAMRSPWAEEESYLVALWLGVSVAARAWLRPSWRDPLLPWARGYRWLKVLGNTNAIAIASALWAFSALRQGQWTAPWVSAPWSS